MAYLGSWKIDDLLTFYCNTHNSGTGAATDADAVPTYRIYEDETATPIATGSMALIDSANTVGFYSEQVQLTTAIGYEKGKCYSIYITATVSTVVGTMSHTFQMEAEVDANTVSGTVTPAANSITSSVIATDAIGAAQIAASAIGASEIATGAITSATFAAGAINAASIATGAIDADALAADAGTEIANAVWALDATGQQTQGTFGQAIGDPAATAKSIWGVANALPDAGALTTLQADTDNIQTRLPAALISGRIDCSVGAMAADVVTAAATAADFGTEVANAVWALDATGQQTQGTFGQAIGDPTTGTSLIARLPNVTPGEAGGVFIAGTNAATTVTTALTTTFTGNLTGSVGSVTGAVGSVTGAVGSVTGAVGSVTGNVGGNVTGSVGTVNAIATNAVNAAALATDAATEIRSLASGTSDSGSTTTMVDADRTEADTDYWKGQIIVFTSGTIVGQARLITGFTPASDTITFSPATTQAVSTQTYEIWPNCRKDIGQILGITVDPTTVQIGANVVQISDDDIAATNAEAFFDGTGYAGTGNTIPTVTSVTNLVTANCTQISGDSVAADNAESFFDGTGYAGTGNTIPTVTTVNGLSAGTIDSILDDAVDGSYTLRQLLRLLGSALGAKVSGAGTATIVFRDLADTKSRITATVDADGNRSAITLDLT